MNRHFAYRCLGFLIAVVLVMLSFASSYHPAQGAGKIVADTGFRPDSNGFSFENYGSEVPATNLTPVEIRRMFGDQVCAQLKNDKCVLTPPAKQFMDQNNADMSGGHCEGMAVLSTLFFMGKEKDSDFGNTTTPTLTLDKNPKLQSEIAYWFTTQYTSPAADAMITDKTPNEVLDILIKAMNAKSEYYDLGVFQANFTNGHAITPYAVQDMGNGLFHIMVYDNNYPKEERFVEVDTKANKWSYMSSTNPKEPDSLYEGDADSKTLNLGPISPRLQKQNCDFCASTKSFKTGGLAQTAPQYNEISLYDSATGNAANLLITDAQGNRLGYVGGKFVNEIPNAHFVAATSQAIAQDDLEPVYFIPTGISFTILLDGTALKKDEITNVSMLGPGYDLAVENIKLKVGQTDTIDFSADGTQISYTPSADEAPDIIVGFEHAGPDYEFDIQGADVQPGATIDVNLDFTKGRLGIHTSGTDEQNTTYGLQVERIDTNADDLYNHDGLPIDTNSTAYIEFAKWDGKTDMPITIEKSQ